MCLCDCFKQDNLLHGGIPRGISTLEKMYFIHMENNALSGSLPIFSRNASTLASIKLYNNQFTGSLSDSYCFLENLRKFILNFNHLTGIPFPRVSPNWRKSEYCP
jgi:hypothetical protein